MKHERYFLITARRELIARLDSCAAADLMDLTEPVMWTGDEYDRSLFAHECTDELVKLLFLDTLRRERGTGRSFGKVFDQWSLSESYFNGWWLFGRVDIDMSVGIALTDALETGSIDALRLAASNDLAEWIDRYRQRNKTGRASER